MRDWGRGAGVGMERLGMWEGGDMEGCRRRRLLVDTEAPFVSGVCVGGGGGGLCLFGQSCWGEPVDRGKEEGDVCR